MPLIEANNLVLGYDRHAIAEGISFTVNKGDYLCIVGENGSGKSTLMKTLLGLTAPLDGKFVFGENLRKNEIGYLPQQTIVQKDFPASVTEIVLSGFEGRMGLRPFHSKAEKEAAARNLDRMGISHLANSCYRNLSGGQQQRVLLARALCATERVLLLDEPVSGLDPNVTVEMYELISRLNREGLTIIMISHDVSAAMQYASHILHIGESVFFGTRDEYLETPEGKLYTELSKTQKARKEAVEAISDKAGQRGETLI